MIFKKNRLGSIAQKTTRITKHAGYSFASKGEAGLFDYLKLLEMAKEISDIKVQPHVYLTEARILYIPDFSVVDVKLNSLVYYEYKGFETEIWKLKKRLYRFYGPAPLRVFIKGYNGPYLQEEIIPK